MRSALLQHSSRNQLWLQCVQMLGWGSIELQQLAAECSCRGWEQRDGGGGKMQDGKCGKIGVTVRPAAVALHAAPLHHYKGLLHSAARHNALLHSSLYGWMALKIQFDLLITIVLCLASILPTTAPYLTL